MRSPAWASASGPGVYQQAQVGAAFRALDGVVAPRSPWAARQRLGLPGPNGAGKTTMVKILLAQVPRTSGEVEILGCLPQDSTRAGDGATCPRRTACRAT